MADKQFSIGVDIGGTFTDCVVIASGGDVFTGKVPTTPDDRSIGFFNAISAAAESRNMTMQEVLAQTSRLAHGTTAGINALVTRQGAKTALLATTGHGDAIRIMDNTGRVTGAGMEEILDYASSSLPESYVPTKWIREITERIHSKGDVVTPLREDQVLAVADELVGEGVEAIAICFLWSHVNPDHEIRAAELIRAAHPDLYVSCSHEVAPRIGEYPRTASTFMNAYIGPLMRNYTEKLEQRARANGFTEDVVFATVEGGLVDPETVRKLPIVTVQSGPVGGVLGCVALAGQMGFKNVITTDMGGTSLDASIVEGGRAVSGDEAVLERHHVYLRRVDVESIGAGGGSIAWYDEATNTIRVGPRSAGSVPGPVCYGRGGTEPTVTDADLVLGLLDPDKDLAGGVKLDLDAATRSLQDLGARAGLSAVECAAGIVRIVDNRMEDLLRRVTLQKGHDPRDFSVWAFGGAAGLHAGLYAGHLGVRNIVVPMSSLASVWSAYGIALSELSRTFQAPVYVHTPIAAGVLDDAFGRLEEDARNYAKRINLPDNGFTLVRKVEMKYAMQWYSVEVDAPEGSFDEANVDELLQRFETAYEHRYGKGSGYSAAGIAVTTVSTTLRVPRPTVVARHADAVREGDFVATERSVYWSEASDYVETPVYQGLTMIPGDSLPGPTLIEFAETTVAVRPGQSVHMDEFKNIVITPAAQPIS